MSSVTYKCSVCGKEVVVDKNDPVPVCCHKEMEPSAVLHDATPIPRWPGITTRTCPATTVPCATRSPSPGKRPEPSAAQAFFTSLTTTRS